jgi:hypothetical protein
MRIIQMPMLMSVFVAMLSWGALTSIASADQGPAPPLPAPPATQIITGDILNIEGEHVVVKDTSGHEVLLRVSKDTRMDRLKVGDKVNATVTADGHAESVEVQMPHISP